MIARLISQTDAQSLASLDRLAFVNDTAHPDRYFTYPDVAFSMGISGSDFEMSSAENMLTGQLTYNAAGGGTYPIRKDRKMFPR